MSCMRYMELTKNLDQRFDDATDEEIAAAGDCLICREGFYGNIILKNDVYFNFNYFCF